MVGKVSKRGSTSQHHFRSWDEFIAAVHRHEIPEGLVSPGWVAAAAGVSRQAVHQAIAAGRIESWHIRGGFILLQEASADVFDRV